MLDCFNEVSRIEAYVSRREMACPLAALQILMLTREVSYLYIP
jgi:hypothetical protein